VSNFGAGGSQPGQFDAPFSVSLDSIDNRRILGLAAPAQ
jgi:hypothetical protein